MSLRINVDVEDTFEVENELGLHARAAAKLVRIASRYRAEIEIEKEGQRANAKSIMGVLLLCCEKGSSLRVRASGEDAREAISAIGQLIAERFGER